MTTAEKLNTVYGAFNGIKDAITEKGGTPGASITEYPQNILDLPSGGGGEAEDMLFRLSTSYTVPSSITSIPNYFAYANTKLLSINLSNVTYIGNAAFYSCENLTTIVIPNSVTTLYPSTFRACTKLASIEIPNSVTSIGDYCFYGCSSLKSISIPNNATSIGSYAFHSCTGLKSISIPNSVTSIGTNAFLSCSNLYSITLPPNLSKIDNATFMACSLRNTLDIPNTVSSIGSLAFYNAVWLRAINFGNTRTTIPTLSSTNAFTLTGSAGTVNAFNIIVPDALYDQWITKTNWSSSSIKDKIMKYSDAIEQGIITE